MKQLFFLLSALLLISSSHLFSQVSAVHGNVHAFQEFPLKNVKVSTKGTDQETYTDSMGNFTILCKKFDEINFKASGFGKQTFYLNGEDSIRVNLLYRGKRSSYKGALKNDHISKNDLDYCLKYSKDKNNNYHLMETVFDIIQFEAPGTMFIVDRFERLRVVLKGAGHHKYNPGNEAKFIVDGEELEDISHIKPEQVKSLKIIKGHNATFAGSEVSYGVIKIELKKEKKLEG